MDTLTLRAPAKINLFLELTRRRPDGYHAIDTIMQELDLCDTLTLTRRTDDLVRLTCDTPGIPCDESNLVVKAALLLREVAGIREGVDMHLSKRIPAGGGMGGGSSDGACALTGLNRLWNTGLSRPMLQDLCARLGSDVAFFIRGGTARCTGRGEVVEPLPAAPGLTLVLVFPEWGVSTPQAYRSLDPARFGTQTPEAMLEAVREGDRDGLVRAMFNRFEEPVFRMEPREGALFSALSGLGFETVRMSGSGSTLFGVAGSRSAAEALAQHAARLPGVREALVAQTV